MLGFSKFQNYLVIIFCICLVIIAMPNILPSNVISKLPKILPHNSVNLGLDLKGGSHLLLKIEKEKYLKEQIIILRDIIRKELKNKKIYNSAKLVENKIILELKKTDDLNDAKKIIKSLQNGLDINIDENKMIIQITDNYLKIINDKLITQSIEIIRRRVDENGTTEPIIQRQGEERIILQVPGIQDPANLKNLLGKTAKMTFYIVDNIINNKDNYIQTNGKIILPSNEGDFYYILDTNISLSGDSLADATASFEQGEPIVQFKLNNYGARQFAEITKNNKGKLLAIILDDKVISAPRIKEPIMGGSGMINGNFTVESANQLALLLRAGALPAELKIIEERLVGPNLGTDSVESGKKAAFIAFIAVIIFMIMTYGLFGIFASIALIFAIIFIFAVMTMIGSTLTMPGIAGIVLTIGMAVDANVLIFERIRELKNSNTVYFSCSQAFKNASSAIIDSNVTTLMVAILLYIFGSGPVKGFAVTLSIGIFATLFAGIIITKLLISWWLKLKRPTIINI